MSTARPNIVTFYSYKGGVGRTFCLANVGVALAKWGYKVLCVDWDLEAPGLHSYLEIEKPSRGMLDLITEDLPWSDVSVQNDEKLPNLMLIGSGEAAPNYLDRLASVNWKELYESGSLSSQIEDWRYEWSNEFDFVLIDSRTGLSDIGAICTAHLPEIVVCCFIANEQNITGTKKVIEIARRTRQSIPFDRNALWFVPVLSRFEIQEEYERATKWRKNAFAAFGEVVKEWIQPGMDPTDVLSLLTLPNIPYWSFGEHLPVVEEQYSTPESLRFRLEMLSALLSRCLENPKFLTENPKKYIDAASRASAGSDAEVAIVIRRDSQQFAKKVQESLENLGSGSKVFLFEEGVDSIAASQAIFVLDGSNDAPLTRLAVSLVANTLETGKDLTILPLVTSKTRNLGLIPSILQHISVSVPEDIEVGGLDTIIRTHLGMPSRIRDQSGRSGRS